MTLPHQQNWIGKPLRRLEDARLLTGQGRFTDDIAVANQAHAAFVRSPYAHARIVAVDASGARAAPGVIAVLTGQEVARQTKPISARAITRPATQYIMAVDKVGYVGEPVAAVAAEDRYLAEDALELIEIGRAHV